MRGHCADHPEPLAPTLVIALDVPSAKAGLDLAGLLRPVTPWMKVGLELFTAAGPGIVKELKGMGCRVFLDLKFHDIPNTVRGAVRSAHASGADIINVHLCGGRAMCEAAVNELAKVGEAPENRAPCLMLGVTVLTSVAADAPDADLSLEGGASLEELVLKRARHAREWGLQGVVCSALEVRAVKQACGKDFVCLCPGIRPERGEVPDDQSRAVTPAEAAQEGADFLVVGRPVTLAGNPLAAAKNIVRSMSAVRY
ncbi:MAG: orotidine-5'-phosphate decarboxylase [Deltaproteobacteria bacterium]|jgi:orotidine-5'-phosphate decarboxylase|nr:orotidine-5'-phosphate decarboxylase [Deltaproteobacteria bacterium]